uniref:Protein kinase domain-containing protein n=1 Tax=Calcidiscus leptoporus TaxID=127549 RepID=A0A7S0IXT1_9EUKA|mmetsp:Transcript_28617/g.67068  ORF Transcript_28617/g.67068 Transcript_28617/m.67068 type:complete len:465 (+) Transcript_28617:149-1543(+)
MTEADDAPVASVCDCASPVKLTELFDLVAECGAMRELDAARCIDALIPLCEAGVRDCPAFRLAPELIMIDKDGAISLRECASTAEGIDPATAKARPVEAYSPPEAVSGESTASGVAATAAPWALGIVLFSLLAGYPPFANARLGECSYFKAFAESNEIHFPHFFSKRAVELLCGLLSRSPASRFTFEQARQHVDSWIAQIAADAASPLAPLRVSLARRSPTPAAVPWPAEGLSEAETKPFALAQHLLPLESAAAHWAFRAGSQKRQRGDVPLPPLASSSGGDETQALPKPIFNSPRSEWPRRRDLSLPGSGSCNLSKPAAMVRHLGWDGLCQPVDELFDEVLRAVRRIEVPVHMVYSSVERPRALLTQMHHVSDGMGEGSMTAEVWIAGTSAEQYGICVKRASGDTFQFHAFYRLLRDALAKTTGWSGSEYSGSVVPGVLPILWRRNRRSGARPTARAAVLPVV